MHNRTGRHARRFFTTSAALALALACGCGGGGGGGSAAQPFAAPPSPTPSPTAPPAGAPSLSQTTVTLTLTGETAALTASEAGYAGAIVPDASACANVASVSPSSANAPATFTVTARGSGACTLAFTDAFGRRATAAVGVTITGGDIK